MNAEHETNNEVWTDRQWWLDFRATYAYDTNKLDDPNQRRVLTEIFDAGQLNHLACYIDVLDLEPKLAVNLVFRFLLNR